jgi:signal transduction histidine kinase
MKIIAIDDERSVLALYEKVLLPPEKNADFDLVQQADELFEADFSKTVIEPWQSSLKVLKASQGEEGITCVKQEATTDMPIALAFIDIQMPPGIDGVETAKEILKVDPKIEIVFVTAYTNKSRQDIEKNLQNKRFFYLQKPFHPDELFQMAQSLILRWETARESDRLKKEKAIFETNMSHELRHPLQIIKGVCDTLLEFDVEKKQQKLFLKDIQTETVRLIGLIEKLQVLQKEPQQNELKDIQPININLLIDKVIRLLSKDALKKGLVLSRAGSTNLPKIQGNESGIMQILINLTVNAINYTEKGEVTINAKQQKDFIEIQIKDTGVGISEDDQKLILKRYFRVKKQALKVRGHGLGLNIVTEMLSKHGSCLSISSQPGKGAIFSFKLKY